MILLSNPDFPDWSDVMNGLTDRRSRGRVSLVVHVRVYMGVVTVVV